MVQIGVGKLASWLVFAEEPIQDSQAPEQSWDLFEMEYWIGSESPRKDWLKVYLMSVD